MKRTFRRTQSASLVVILSFVSVGRGQPSDSALGEAPVDSADSAQSQSLTTSASDPAIDPADMFERYFHTYNTDFQYFFMRHRLKLDEVLVSASASQSSNGAFDAEAKGFMPLYESERFSFMLPFYFFRYALSSEQRDQLPYDAMHAFFWQAVGRFKLSERLDLLVVTEGRHNGTEESLAELVGTEVAEFVVLNFDMSPRWTLAASGRAKVTWNSEREREWQLLPAGHVIFRPSDKLSIMSGVPSLFALEWASDRVDLATHVMLAEGNNINVMSAARVNLNRNLAVTGRLIRDGYQDVYVPKFEFEGTGGGLVDQVAQFRNRLQGELEVSLSENSTMQLKAGYGFDQGVTLRGNDMEVATVEGDNGFYGGLTFITRHQLARPPR